LSKLLVIVRQRSKHSTRPRDAARNFDVPFAEGNKVMRSSKMAQAQARIDEPRPTQGRGEDLRSSQRYSEESNGAATASILPTEFVEIGKKHVETMMEIQKELFDVFQEINQAWFDRARSAVTINSELIAKLTSARTVPETAEAYQQCMGKRMELLVEDGRRLFADSQKIVNLGTKFLANGSGRNGSTV